MIKLFVSDLDGTLLNDNHVISNQTAKAVKALQKTGVEFMVATGRDYYSAHKVLVEQQIKCRMINLNGATIHDEEGNVLHTQPLHKEDALAIMDYLESQPLNATLIATTGFYVSDYENYVKRMKRFMVQKAVNDADGEENITEAQLSDHYREIKPLSELNLQNLPEIYKIMFFSEDLELLKQARLEIEKIDNVDVTSSSKDNIEITHINAQKGLAVEQYVANQDYDMTEVATIGDSFNDRSMIKMAGHSYGMANGADAIKEMARYIAPPNTEDGVAQVIYQIIEDQTK